MTNVGAAPTNGSVVVSDPMGLPLIPRSAIGQGWTCETLSTLIRCLRSDALAPGASYPPITMTVSIAADAPPTVTNVVSVSGGGDGNAVEQQCHRRGDGGARRGPVDHEEPRGQLHPGAARHLHVDDHEQWRRGHQRLRERRRSAARRPGSHHGERHRVDL